MVNQHTRLKLIGLGAALRTLYLGNRQYASNVECGILNDGVGKNHVGSSQEFGWAGCPKLRLGRVASAQKLCHSRGNGQVV